MADLNFINKQAERMKKKNIIDLTVIGEPRIEYGITKQTLTIFKEFEKESLNSFKGVFGDKEVKSLDQIYKIAVEDTKILYDVMDLTVRQGTELIKKLAGEEAYKKLEEYMKETVGEMYEESMNHFCTTIMKEFNELLSQETP